MSADGQAEAAATLARYKELDLDFGIDQAALELLLKLDKGEGDDMVSVLDAGTRTCVPLPVLRAARATRAGPCRFPLRC